MTAATSAAGRHGRRHAILDGLAIMRTSRQGTIGLAVLLAFTLIAVVGPFIVGPIDKPGTFKPLLPPSLEHYFGTDRAGRDLFVTNVWASRISLLVGVLASIMAMVIGTAVGIGAGYLGGRWDGWLMAITDFFYVLPTLVLAIVLAAILGPSLVNVIIVIAITSWPATARVIRSQTLSIRERMFVDRARAYGSSSGRIMRRQVLPNVMGLVLANTTLTIAAAIFLETTLSFLGVGPRDTFSWGRILEDSFQAGALTLGLWAWFVPPGVAVVLVVLAFTMIGAALDEVVDPRLRRRHGGGPTGAEDVLPMEVTISAEEAEDVPPSVGDR